MTKVVDGSRSSSILNKPGTPAATGRDSQRESADLPIPLDPEFLGVCLYRLDPSNDRAYVFHPCSSFLRSLGYPRARLQDPHFWPTLIHPEDRPVMVEANERLLRGEKSFCQYRILTQEGKFRWVSDKARPIIENGLVSQIEGIVQDITSDIESKERLSRQYRQLSLELQQNKVTLRAIFDATPDMIVLIDPAGVILDANRAAYRFLGKKPEQVLGRNSRELLLALLPESRIRMVEQVARRRHPMAFEDRIGDHQVEYRLFPVIDQSAQTNQLAIFARDITAQRLLEKALQHSQARLKHITESMWDLVGETDQEGRLVYASPGFHRVLGHFPEELLGKPWLDLVHREDRATAITAFLGAPAQEGATRLESRILHADGHLVWMDVMVRPLREEGQEAQGFILSLWETSERKRIEDENNRLKEESLLYLLQESSECVGLVQNGKLILANPTFARLLGEKSPGALLGREFLDFVAGGDRKRVDSIMRRIQNHSTTMLERLELTMLRTDGMEASIECSFYGMEYRQARCLLIRGLDISARRRAEQTLKREVAKKITSELASGVAHEIRNPLFIISLSVQAIEKRLPANDPQRRLTRAILDKVHKLDKVTAGLVRLGKYDELNMVSASLRNRVDLTLILVRASARAKRVKIVRRHTPRLPRAWIDPEAMDAVLANLFTNAMEAMTRGGVLTVETAFDQETGELLVRIQDTGNGIRKSIREKVFDPFFTTKETGSGIGLVFCKRIVEEHGGRLTFESKTGGAHRGTTFQITLPASRQSNGRGKR
ncbi:MAG: PAS domain S-box protein [Coprothermobacterota bacterium]|nr:PAS domain S-box protein [Coprothermobacterota bacterium]